MAEFQRSTSNVQLPTLHALEGGWVLADRRLREHAAFECKQARVRGPCATDVLAPHPPESVGYLSTTRRTRPWLSRISMTMGMVPMAWVEQERQGS